MNAITEFDVGPLTWVKGEIDQALTRVREDLAKFSADVADASPLRFCLTHLHQVTGALQMVGMEGVARVTGEIEHLVSAIEKQEVAPEQGRLDLINQAIDTLSRFLDEVLAGEPYRPLALFPVYSDLLRSRNAERPCESDLFFPDLEVRAPKNPNAKPVAESELPPLVKKERAKFQLGLLNWLRQKDPAQSLKSMRDALQAIEGMQTLPAHRTFWWAAVAFIESLMNQGLEPDFNIKQLCGRIDLQMRRLAEGSQKVAERLLRDVLYFVARSKQVSDRVKEVKNIFELENHLPPAVRPIAPGSEALLGKLRETLAEAKDAWLKFTSGSKENLKDFLDHVEELQSKSAGLDNRSLRQLIDQIGGVSPATESLPQEKAEAAAMEMATALLLVENALENYENLTGVFSQQADIQAKRLQAAIYGNIDMSDIPQIPLLDEISRRAQEKLMVAQVVHEIQTNLRHIEQVVDSFFRDNSKRNEIPGIEPLIQQVLGALKMLELERASDLLRGCHTLIAGFADPDHPVLQEELELVADGLSSLGFYMEAVRNNQPDAYQVIAEVIKRFPGYKGREEAPTVIEEPEIQGGTSTSVEAGIHDQKKTVQERFAQWQQHVEDDASRANLQEALTALRHDADLIADSELKDQAAKALDQLKQSTEAPSDGLAASIAAITQPRMHAESSERTARLINATAESVDAELLEIFLEEAQEVLATISERLHTCRQQPHNGDSLGIIRRGFHTLKGSGRMVGLNNLGEIAWAVEEVLNKWLDEERNAGPALLHFIGMAHDAFAGWVTSLKAEGSVAVRAEELLALAEQLKRGEEPPLAELAAPGPEAPSEEPPAPGEAPSVEVQPTGLPEQTLAVVVTPQPEAEATTETPSPELPSTEPLIEAAIEAKETVPEATLGEMEPPSPEVPTREETAIDAALGAESPEIDYSELAARITPEPEAETAVEIEGVAIAPALFTLFLAEAQQHIDTLSRELYALSAEPEKPIHEDFMRAAHTLCGIASTTGFDSLSELGYAMEQWLKEMLEHSPQVTDKHLKVMQDCVITLDKMLRTIRERKRPRPAKQVVRSLQAILKKARNERLQKAGQEMPRAAATTVIAAVEEIISPHTSPAEEATAQQTEISALPAGPVTRAAEPERRIIRDDLDEQLLPIFLEEAHELFPQIGEQLRAWHAAPENPEVPQSLQRTLHTLKGSARMAGAMRLGELTHSMEARVIATEKQGGISPTLIDELEADFDKLGDTLEQLRHGTEPAPVAEISAAAAATAPQPTWTVATPQLIPQEMEQAAQKAQLRVRADVLDRLVNEAGEVSIARSRVEGEMQAFKQTLLDLTENVIRLRNQLREVDIQAESQMQSQLSHLQEDNPEFDPLEFDRFTRFQELTRMMAESVNDVSTVQQNLLKNLNETEAALLQQARMTKDLQQELMRIRMVPFGSLAERLHRIVRQTAKELGKKVNLEIGGSQVEMDRSVLEKMTAPFEHLLRNAIVHGLEKTEQRLAAGKTAFGEIRLEVRQEGNEIVLLFSDDGAGIDLNAIRSKALELGMLEANANPTPAQLTEMIFLPGFSTAKEITQVAGRGIGMDVVRNEIASLGGRIEVDTTPGKGTSFIVSLPLTLAVTQAVLVHAGNLTFALPSIMVEQVQEINPETLAKLYEAHEVEWQGNHYPFAYLPHLLGNYEETPTILRHNFIILLRSGTHRAAIHVDKLTGNREVVVKNIGPQLARVSGIAGATVLGNGSVVLIINPVQLAQREAALAGTARPAAQPKADTAPLILVVDDSLTVRKITSRLLSREGYQVVTAKDGVDALLQMQNGLPDVMLVDIEMPRMDGFELTRNVRGDPQTAHIPIIMITSRTAEKHRNFAKELGVNAYLGKPYQEEELLEHIADFVRQSKEAVADSTGQAE
jgi:chemosensory pili system protein ChpA (sensor histidine kinase/response regulator)